MTALTTRFLHTSDLQLGMTRWFLQETEDAQALFDAAHAGALDTEDLAAKKGRASYLGDRSKGVIDPGAIVVSWLFGGEPLSAH